ncbi:16S rRNA (adenine(1518)-N(6)/adenine(1519)-N(6))-dimethyltransferase RsmA [Acetilactobacillus jinshanensis]|uniref:Ribosomal RNA small subunit methyltransferase A n=1 Tax=Acetilactobacillus jinshanensis TaxID=1720083 RepID=A0A4P6ZMN1_9LACO|nr:16S rRNA (adenine(1518)-N(6)/adenine(1519)-N(6))-dimethyltransferase RsmA [Acetilactobacillus jinshanensis]QBP18883.1 16S rRNA (adenine(1518)-N(6)/adenine(1519)-N(6))-dimethyltransferase RsmA [Acetilactobacillus jinshanensis]URL60568.1 16S rRNA (adenine(1518)-N(6)/adenine(1519)-N(6))-dimethyltransferase RsmA [uncultured bacterium]
MNNIPAIATPSRTSGILNRHHLKAKHSLGQNFLIDLNVLREIMDAANLTADDDVIEIGPGIGGLTEQLAQRAHKVIAFEIDSHLIPILHETLSQYHNVKIINQDILKANLPKIIKNDFDSSRKVKIVANLPYYITTPIIVELMKSNARFSSIAVTMQKEVAERVSAKPGSKTFGAISVLIQYLNNVKITNLIPKTAFYPSPKVTSAIVRLTRRHDVKTKVFEDDAFAGFVRGCFAHRRKTFQNNLKSLFGKDARPVIKKVLTQEKVNPMLRPEKLSVETYVKLANAFHQVGLL